MRNIRQVRDRIMRKEEAESILAPHLPSIATCCLTGIDAWQRFCQQSPDLREPLTGRTLASFVNDSIVSQARVEFAKGRKPGVEAFDDMGFLCVAFGRRIVLRFKKTDGSNHPRNIPTQQQQDLAVQQLIIEGWQEATWLSVCCQITTAGDAISKIVISCWFSDNEVWNIPVYDANDGTSQGTIQFPDPQPAPQRRSRVVPKDMTIPEGE